MSTNRHHRGAGTLLARRAERSLPVEAMLGVLAGAGAAWVMDQATGALYARQSKEVTQQENEACGGKIAYGVAAEKAAGSSGKSSRTNSESSTAWTSIGP